MDTLDYSGGGFNQGSKLVMAAGGSKNYLRRRVFLTGRTICVFLGLQLRWMHYPQAMILQMTGL